MIARFNVAVPQVHAADHAHVLVCEVGFDRLALDELEPEVI